METEVRRRSGFRFGLFEADPARNTLTRSGSQIRIQDQPFRVLIHLLEKAGETVPREELRHLLWSDDTFVDFDASLNVILKKLRTILRDDSENPRFIETVPRRGYRFIAPVTVVDSDSDSVQGGLNDLSLRPNVPVGSNYAADARRRWWPRAIQFAAVAALAISVTLAVIKWKQVPIASAPVVHSNILPPPNTSFVPSSPALARDGRTLAFVAKGSNGSRALLWVQDLGSGTAHSLAGTEDAALPFWSPDGHHIGFFARGKLWRIDAEGGPPQMLSDAPLGRGGAWNQDGLILFAPDLNGPLQEISGAGGAPRAVSPLSSQSDLAHAWWPQFLPDGKHFIYWSHSNKSAEVDGIYVGQLRSTERRLLVATESSGLYADGNLLYLHDQALLARRFDLNHLTLSGVSKLLAQGIGIQGGMHLADFTASQNSLLAYLAGRANQGWPMVMYDRSGKPEAPIFPERNIYLDPRFSPDGKRLAVSIARPDNLLGELWVIDLHAGTRTRLTFQSNDAKYPVWSPDEKTIYFSASNGPDRLPHIYARLSSGAGNESAVLETAGVSEIPMDISKDGRDLVYARHENGKNWEIWKLSLLQNGKPLPLLQHPSGNLTEPALSRDEKWVAYSSDESGHFEVYISALAGRGQWQVSLGGGTDPAWAPNGKRLFFVDAAEDIMYVDVRANGTAVELTKPVRLVQNATFPMQRPIAIAPDGRLLVNGHNDEPTTPQAITLVTNWSR